jgi:hypothetical protein
MLSAKAARQLFEQLNPLAEIMQARRITQVSLGFAVKCLVWWLSAIILLGQ